MLPGCRLLLTLALLAAAGSTLAKTPRDAERRLERQQAIQALILRADADSLAAAAVLSFRQATSPSALELAVSAAELAPQNAAIGWLHLQICVESSLCDFRDAATVLRWVDADNGASWLPILDTAYKDRDWTEVERVLVDMAQAPRFDLYWNRLVVLMTDALKRAHGALPKGYAASDADRFELISGIMSELVPPFSALVDVCRTAPPAATERREACMTLARTMQRGDTVVVQIAGFGIERRLIPAESKEAEKLAERRKLLESRVAAAEGVDSPAPSGMRNSAARLRLAKMREYPREEDVCIALLRGHRITSKPLEISP